MRSSRIDHCLALELWPGAAGLEPALALASEQVMVMATEPEMASRPALAMAMARSASCRSQPRRCRVRT